MSFVILVHQRLRALYRCPYSDVRGDLPSWAGGVCVGRHEAELSGSERCRTCQGFIPGLVLEKKIYGISMGFLKVGPDVAEGTNWNLREGNIGVFYFLSE